MTQLVKCLSLARIMILDPGIKPYVGLPEEQGACLSLSLCPSPPLLRALVLSQKSIDQSINRTNRALPLGTRLGSDSHPSYLVTVLLEGLWGV